MSTERFDKRLKESVESVRPTYQPRAWDRFSKRLPAVGFWPWLLQHGGWVLSGLMLTGWVTTLHTLHENQRILTELTQTKASSGVPVTHAPRVHKSAKPASVSATNKPREDRSVTKYRLDTVYIVQRTVVEHRHVYLPANRLTNPVDDARATQPNRPIRSDTVTVATMSPGVQNALPAEPITHPSRITNPARPKTSRRQKNLPTQPTTQVQNASGSVFNPANQRIITKKPAHDLASSNRSANSVSRQTITTPPLTSADSINRIIDQATSDLVFTDSTQIQPIQSDSVAQPPTRIAPSATTVTLSGSAQQATRPLSEPTKNSRPPFRLSALQPRVGIEIGTASNGIGVGPAIEFFPAENLGLSVGIQAWQLRAVDYGGVKDFNAATGTEFIKLYRDFLPDKFDKIEDISILTSLVSLPVHLKYYIPFHQNWSLYVQAGSNFDLAAYRQVTHESYYEDDEQHRSFDVKAQVSFFHNFIFGAGVQYQHRRISAQLSPYYRYDFRNIANVSTGNAVGIKGSIWLNLVKP